MANTLILGLPTVKRPGETKYLSTLVVNVSRLMDVHGDRSCLFSCLFHMCQTDNVDFQEKQMGTTKFKITKKNIMCI